MGPTGCSQSESPAPWPSTSPQTPNVIGWQIDNEFGGEECHCGSCLAEFQDWLRTRYGTLDELNRAWGNHFWGLKFTTWGEITIPDCATDRDG